MSHSSSNRNRNIRVVAENRWRSVTAWTISQLDVLLHESLLAPYPGLHIRQALLHYSAVVKNRLANYLRKHKSIPCIHEDRTESSANCSIKPWEIDFLFSLEAELWGPHPTLYEQLHPFDHLPNTMPEYFRFPIFFYLVERTMTLFDTEDRYNKSRSKFCEKVIEKCVQKIYPILGETLSLCISVERPEIFVCRGHESSETSNDIVAQQDSDVLYWGESDGTKLQNQSSYFASLIFGLSGKSAISVLRKAFENTRKVKLSEKNKKKKHSGNYFGWYDVLWHYSESMRYRPVHGIDLPAGAVFYGNLAPRWLGTLLLTGFLRILMESGAPVETRWERFSRRAPQFYELMGGEARFG